MLGHADDELGVVSERLLSSQPREKFHRIIEASKRARCVVRVLMSESGMTRIEGTDLKSDADVRILVITEDFQIKGGLHSDVDNLSGSPLLAYLADYDEVSELLALRAGFSDVLHPQMSERILTERIMASWNRKQTSRALSMEKSLEQERLQRPFELDLVNRIFEIDGRAVSLSKMETQLLQILGSNFHRPVSREEIHTAIKPNSRYDSRTVDSHIKRLRKKFTDAGIAQSTIKTIYGLGYRIDPTA